MVRGQTHEAYVILRMILLDSKYFCEITLVRWKSECNKFALTEQEKPAPKKEISHFILWTVVGYKCRRSVQGHLHEKYYIYIFFQFYWSLSILSTIWCSVLFTLTGENSRTFLFCLRQTPSMIRLYFWSMFHPYRLNSSWYWCIGLRCSHNRAVDSLSGRWPSWFHRICLWWRCSVTSTINRMYRRRKNVNPLQPPRPSKMEQLTKSTRMAIADTDIQTAAITRMAMRKMVFSLTIPMATVLMATLQMANPTELS